MYFEISPSLENKSTAVCPKSNCRTAETELSLTSLQLVLAYIQVLLGHSPQTQTQTKKFYTKMHF